MADGPEHDMIKNITQSQDSWRIKGRILYSWEQFWRDSKEPTDLEFIIIDSEGTKIQASMARRFFFKHKSLVAEGEVRFIANFSVSKNIGDYRITKHPYKIVFTAKTIFSSTVDINIPHPPIEFASFNDIIRNNLDPIYLVDIIGELHSKGPLETTSKNKRTMLVELIDCEGQKMITTLWEKLVDHMASSTTEFDKCEHRPIVIIRGAKIKKFQDSSVSNSLCSTILLDAEIPEVRNFIKRKADVGLKYSSSSTTILTSYSETVANELLDIPARHTIGKIKELQEEGYFVTLATITAIDDEFKWYIESCKKGRAIVELDDKEKWLCTGKCEGYAKFVILRYKVRVKVVDHTGDATFILFDTQANDLIRQSAKQLRDNQLKHENPNGYPSELNVLLNRRFIFKVKVDEKYNLSKGWKSYGVNKLSEDKDLIQKFLAASTSQRDCLEVDSRDESVVHNDNGQEAIRGTIENIEDESVTSSVNITPTKRLLEDAFENEDDAQLSTTKKHVPDQSKFTGQSV